MKNVTNRNAYYKQLKNGKLRFITNLYLRHCGKKDVKLHIIRKNEKEHYISPFIMREIHLYTVAIKMEQEAFINTLIQDQIQIKLVQLKAAEKEIQKQQYNNTGIFSLGNRDLENKEFHDLASSITAINSQKEEMLLLKRREQEILRLRCDQLYNILFAKISAYWSGVLRANKDEPTIPPVFTIDTYIPDLEIPCDDL